MHTLHTLPEPVVKANSRYWYTLDPRLKLMFCLGVLMWALFIQHISPLVVILTWCAGILLLSGISLREIIKRLYFPLFLAGTALLLKLFTHGESALFSFSMLGGNITAYREGLYTGGVIFLRIIAGMQVVLFLALTTPTPKLLQAARWFRVPALFIELTLLCYSYIFLFYHTAGRLYDAQRVRLGYLGAGRGIKSLADLVGLIFIQAYDQSRRTYQAMLVRGYHGKLVWPGQSHVPQKLIRDSVVLISHGGLLYGLNLALRYVF